MKDPVSPRVDPIWETERDSAFFPVTAHREPDDMTQKESHITGWFEYQKPFNRSR